MTDTDARLWHPWLRINRVLRVMLHTRWSAEAWAEVRVEFKKALALRSEIRRRGSSHPPREPRGDPGLETLRDLWTGRRLGD
jgi:hypothetical protein